MSGFPEDRSPEFDRSDRPSPKDAEAAPAGGANHPMDQTAEHAASGSDENESAWAEAEQALASAEEVGRSPQAAPVSAIASPADALNAAIPLGMVETAFLASTASLLWLVSYYLSIGAWMRIVFPAPIALVYLRWGNRAAWMSVIVSSLLLSVLMGPYLSLMFLIPYGLLGVQLGAMWRRGAPWSLSISTGTIVATFSFFFRIWLLSAFIGEDLWVYLTGRITDLLEWITNHLVDWGLVGVGLLGQPDVTVVQIATVIMVLFSDLVYLFTVHLATWLLFERLGNPIPIPPRWVQILLEEE